MKNIKKVGFAVMLFATLLTGCFGGETESHVGEYKLEYIGVEDDEGQYYRTNSCQVIEDLGSDYASSRLVTECKRLEGVKIELTNSNKLVMKIGDESDELRYMIDENGTLLVGPTDLEMFNGVYFKMPFIEYKNNRLYLTQPDFDGYFLTMVLVKK